MDQLINVKALRRTAQLGAFYDARKDELIVGLNFFNSKKIFRSSWMSFRPVIPSLNGYTRIALKKNAKILMFKQI